MMEMDALSSTNFNECYGGFQNNKTTSSEPTRNINIQVKEDY
jgi:hypothetical protein